LASISSTNLAELPVVVPPAIDRSAILLHIHQATGKLDALIAKVREHIEKLREYRAALISAAVSGKIDVREEVT
jgi:type I restriction enzyme S subunit